MITFSSRPRIKRTLTGKQRSFTSEDGRYRIVQIISSEGTRWLACRRLVKGEYPVGRGKSRADVERACELHRKG